jgi:superfamily II DNA or RNA helicase
VPWAVKLALAHQGERIIIFHERVESLNRIIALLAQHGQNSVAYHSQLSEYHRRDNLRLFRRGMVDVLVTCRALDEGANVPEANIAIVARSTSSTRQRIQRLGRVLRPANGKNAATVFTLYAGEEERDGLALEAEGLEGVARVVWKRGTVQ